MNNIDIIKEFLYMILLLFSVETFLDLITFIIYPSFFQIILIFQSIFSYL